MSIESKNERIYELENVLRGIAILGGNLPDERLTSETGPSDAVARGLMYVEARRQALQALHTTLDEMWK